MGLLEHSARAGRRRELGVAGEIARLDLRLRLLPVRLALSELFVADGEGKAAVRDVDGDLVAVLDEFEILSRLVVHRRIFIAFFVITNI